MFTLKFFCLAHGNHKIYVGKYLAVIFLLPKRDNCQTLRLILQADISVRENTAELESTRSLIRENEPLRYAC